METICECGCGGLIPWAPHHKYRPVRFLRGHYSRTATNRKARARKVREMLPHDFQPPSGLCECGCGGKTPIAKQNRYSLGHYRGNPIRYVRGHNPRGRRAHNWRGGRKVTRAGYVLLWNPDHHLANANGYVSEHRIAWEEANHRRLRANEDVHHIDGNRSNNDPSNLVALTKAEHTKLHAESKESRAKMSEAQRRRYRDPEARAKMSEATRKAWAEGRMKR